MAVFSSTLLGDYRPESDIDVLVCFEKDAPWSLLDLASMKLELEQPFSREVDLVEKSTVEKSYNWIRREDILSSAQSLVER